MAQTNWQNLPSTNTPLNATNLNKIENKFTYSTSEQEVGTWINGKPIYRKVLNIGTIASQSTINTGIVNMDKLINLTGTSKLENSYGINLPSNGDAVSGVVFRMRLQDNGTKLAVECSSNSFVNTYIIIEYTKTTD